MLAYLWWRVVRAGWVAVIVELLLSHFYLF